MRRFSMFKIFAFAVILVTVLGFFQNCTRVQEFSSGSIIGRNPSLVPLPPNFSGNGDGYGGKPTSFEFRDTNQPCSDRGANGRPLPNNQMFKFAPSNYQMVRRGCTDITPVNVPLDQITLLNNGDLSYQNQIYSLSSSFDDFDIVAATCPVGQFLETPAIRLNLLDGSQDLGSDPWGGLKVQGYTLQNAGSMAGLPVYKILRNDSSALENYRRPAQDPMQEANESYVFSFFVRPHPTEKALFISDSLFQDLEIEFDLITGAGNVLVATGVSNVSTSAKFFGGGLFISIYFKNNTETKAHIGVASKGEFFGSSIDATAFQLELVSNFCSP